MAARTRSMIATAILLVFGLGLGGVALAEPAPDDYDSQKQQQQAIIDAADARSEEIDAALETTNGQLAEAITALAVLDGQVTAAAQALVEAQGEVDRIAQEVTILQGRLTAAEAEAEKVTGEIELAKEQVEQLKVMLAQIAQAAYKNVDVDAQVVLLLTADSLQDYANGAHLQQTVIQTKSQAVEALEQINAVNRSRQTRLIAIQDQITVLKEQMEIALAEAEEAKKAAEAAKAHLESLQHQQQVQVDSLAQFKADLEAEYAAQDAARQEALKKISDINAAEQAWLDAQAQAQANAQKNKPQNTASQNSSSAYNPYGLANPTAYRPAVITSSYGMRYHPVLHYTRMHWGTDLRSFCGDPIYAAQAGIVQWSSYLAGYGNQVMLSHGTINGASIQTSYSHLSKFVVGSGQKVAKGQLIGYSGNTGTSAACHLHWEVFVNGSNVNPMSVVNW